VRATEVLIKAWRKAFNQGDLPFYYVQIAPFQYENKDLKASDIAFFREKQTALGN